jgi:hypothetical protein
MPQKDLTMNLSDLLRGLAWLTTGKAKVLLVVIVFVSAGLYRMAEIEFYLSAASTQIEQLPGCERTGKLLVEALATDDIQPAVDSYRQGDCYQEVYRDKSRDNINKGLNAADPFSLPSLTAPVELIESTKRLKDAYSKDN